MIEPVYFDTCLCCYFDKILTAQKIQNRGKYQKFCFSLLSGGGAPINPNELKVPKIPKKKSKGPSQMALSQTRWDIIPSGFKSYQFYILHD